MKKALFSALLLLAAWSAAAQVYLVKQYTPTESRRYNPHYKGVRNYENDAYISNFSYTNGFSFWNGVTFDQAKEYGYAVFHVGGKYEKISFVMGPGRSVKFAAADDANHLVLVMADGRRILDEVVYEWSAPREYVLDISGVDELRFEHWTGLDRIDFEEVRLWKKGETPTPVANPLAAVINKDRVKLVEELEPHMLCHRGWSVPITKKTWNGVGTSDGVKMNRITYTSGFEFSASQEFGKGISQGFAYFWLQRKFDKISFLIGPRDNMSSGAQGWFTVKADGKIIYEKLVGQQDLVENVVLDVSGAEIVSMHSGELEESRFLGGLTFGVVDIYAYKNSYSGTLPQAGTANTALSRISKLPDATRLCSSMEPYSIQGKASFDEMYFSGRSSHYHFSMGGEQFDEGLILTSYNSFMDGNVSSYALFDLAGEFDWLSFTVGTLSKRRVLDEDRLLVYADDRLILDTDVHCLWPNQRFSLPIGKCRKLMFARPGSGKDKQTFIGIGDIMVFRGQPLDVAPYFDHPKPYSPDEVDLIDYCKGPYFHYVGRYLSSLTNFDFNDCFKNGSSIRDAFQMKDGSRINKGIMLETNVPPALAFEDIDLNTAIFIFTMGAGSAMSSSSVAAATGVSAGAGLAGALAAGYSSLNLVGDKGHQSAVAAFNPYGEYETLTFTVANKSEYVDTDLFGARQNPDNPVKLHVFADMQKVGEWWLLNSMPPTTLKVPINKCTQLMFWLECGESRSGQYVLYDMTLSKTPLPVEEWPLLAAVRSGGESTVVASTIDRNAAKGRVVWNHPASKARVEAIDNLFRDVDEVWAKTNACLDDGVVDYEIKETFVQTRSGKLYKAVSLVRGGERYGFKQIIARNRQVMENSEMALLSIAGAYVGVPGANLGILNLEGDRLFEFPSYVKLASKTLGQCRKDLKELNKAKEKENEMLQTLMKQSLSVEGIDSTDKVLLLPLGKKDKVPEGNTFQMLEYYRMN